MNIDIKPNYFSIWRTTFSLFRQQARLLTAATAWVALPFFMLNAVANARQMMTLGGASMMGMEVPEEQMRLLWASMVGSDSLASIALSMVVFLVLKYLTGHVEAGFIRHARQQLPRLLRNSGFWLFACAQVLVFSLINSPDGRLKMCGMALLGCSVLLLLGDQDRDAPAYGRRLRQLGWGGWLSLVMVVLTIPLLYIFLNGYVNVLLLMLADFAAQGIMQLFDLDLHSPLLPYSVITVSRSLSQWFNLLPMVLLLSTCLALRGTEPASREDRV
ncbi:MAG: hypothetical protein V4488_22575 [Pseudomonadota bacterium]